MAKASTSESCVDKRSRVIITSHGVMLLLAGSFVIASFVIFFWFIRCEEKRPIFGVYNQRSRWFPLKFALYVSVFYLLKSARRLRSRRRNGDEWMDLDKPLELANDIKAFDGVLFTGGNRRGYYFAMAAERCHGNVTNGYFYLLVPKRGLFCSFKLPDTILFDGRNKHFGAEGISITSASPMRKWKLSYKGVMWLYPDRSRKVYVRFTAQWTSSFGIFDCFEHFNPLSLAKSIATEPWSSEFFESMRQSLHVNYLQMGSARAECTIGSERHNFLSPSFRSRQYGVKRSPLHRSASFQIFLENGVTLAIEVVRQRSKITEELGYVQRTDGTINVVDWCDFQLYQHGEHGRPPVDHGFQFKAGGTTYAVQIKVIHEYMHFIGWNWETKVIVRFLSCIVNGIPGRGTSEFQYGNEMARRDIINRKDPEWFQIFRPHYIYS